MFSSPEQDAGRSLCSKPFDGGFHEPLGHSKSPARFVDKDVVDETRRLAQLFPGSRLESRVDVTNNGPVTFREEYNGIFIFQL